MLNVIDAKNEIDLDLNRKIIELENEIQRLNNACRSDWPRPVDYTNLMDAHYSLRDIIDFMSHG